MAFEIDIRSLKEAVNAILDHLTDDLGIRTLAIEKGDDFYWECPARERFDTSRQPLGLEVGQLSDDVDFAGKVFRGQSGDATYNLVHIAPLLRYIAEKVKR